MGDIGPRHPHIDMKCLPDISRSEMYFHDTSFFLKNPSRQLPTPAFILERHPELGSGIDKFEDMDMVVKYGPSDYLRLEEAQTIYAIKKAFPEAEVPVPEVFGWRTYRDYNFIYMSLIKGPTLRQAWPSLNESDKEAIATELSGIITALQPMTGNSPEALIGSVNGGTVQDRFFKLDYERGPFTSIRDFNDWVFAAATHQQSPKNEKGIERVYRDFLPDCGNVFFTHGDLTLGNIILSTTPDSSKKIAAIIDWEQAGWYPEYWEYCKLQYGVEYHHEWRKHGWADKLMKKQFEDESFAFSEYSSWRGCP